MPLTVNVGYSRKLGRPDFGSVGASCHVECELDGQLAFDDPEKFQSKIRELYTACRRPWSSNFPIINREIPTPRRPRGTEHARPQGKPGPRVHPVPERLSGRNEA